MRFADIRLVVGTRPEAIKLQPVARALRAQGFEPVIILTGQHPLDPQQFGLGSFRCQRLHCAGQENPHEHVDMVVRALRRPLADAPDLLIVQGDTSSALGGAIAGFRARVPVAHVEAGLRTHDRLPWPEEQFRTSIDAGSSLLFAPTRLAAANLRAERVNGEVHITGNTAVDATQAALRRLPASVLRENSRFRILVTCHRRESWDSGLPTIAAALTELVRRRSVQVDLVLHPNPYVANRMTQLLGMVTGVQLLQPCGHGDLLSHMRNADLVLSDSGGIQEEAPTLGVPLLILRDRTERPEGVMAGVSRLIGTATDRILAEVCAIIDDPLKRAAMSRPCEPFGDGRAAERIAAITRRWIEERRLTRRIA